MTVAVFGLTAVPVARRLGVTRPARARPLLVGGDDWVIDLGRGAQLEGITAVLLLTDEDDFNALGSTVLQGSDGRLAPVTRSGPLEPEPGDSMVVLTAWPAGWRLVIPRG